MALQTSMEAWTWEAESGCRSTKAAKWDTAGFAKPLTSDVGQTMAAHHFGQPFPGGFLRRICHSIYLGTYVRALFKFQGLHLRDAWAKGKLAIHLGQCRFHAKNSYRPR